MAQAVFYTGRHGVEQVYRGRKPKASPLWQCHSHHFDEFLEAYEERYQPRYGFLRPIIPEVVEKFLECGDLGPRLRPHPGDHCKEDRLLAFSCKGRSAPMETHAFGFRLRANAPEGHKRFPTSRRYGQLQRGGRKMTVL